MKFFAATEAFLDYVFLETPWGILAVIVIGGLLGGVFWSAAQEKTTAESAGILALSKEEKTELENLQLKRALVTANFNLQMGEIRGAAQAYAEEVKKAHPGTRAVFDFDTLGWIQRPEPEEKRKGEKK